MRNGCHPLSLQQPAESRPASSARSTNTSPPASADEWLTANAAADSPDGKPPPSPHPAAETRQQQQSHETGSGAQ